VASLAIQYFFVRKKYISTTAEARNHSSEEVEPIDIQYEDNFGACNSFLHW
jgi:hypothetical protein